MALKLTTRNVDGVTVIEAIGRIILGQETNDLRESLKGLLANGATKIVINLANVDFIDSSGLGALVGLYSTANSRGAKIRLAAITKRFHELLMITKLLTVFDVYDDEAAAVASFK
ncbi:MAG TPA: STAS domain-containing protein [Terriglobales bacterium]|nr:STAS domain-containing protein [Terriglobales bacterium]